MNKITNNYFYNPTKGNLSFEQVVEEIFKYILEKPEKFYDVVVGCDSSSEDRPSFPVVIVVLRVGAGGRFFLKKIKYPLTLKKKFSNWHQRILEEVLLSCELALSLRENLEKKLQGLSFEPAPLEVMESQQRHKTNKPLTGPNYQFRYIHADVGEHGQTQDMIKEIVGLIKSNGFEAKIKPEAYAASVVADRFT